MVLSVRWTRRRLLTSVGSTASLPFIPGMIGTSAAARPEIVHGTIAEAQSIRNGSVRLLTIDPVTKASTSLYTFPSDWKGGGVAHYHAVAEEAYILDGDITLDGQDMLVTGSYLYRPGGIVHGHHEASPHGSRFIIRTSGEIDFHYIHEPTSPHEYVLVPNTDGRPHVLHLKTPVMAAKWTGSGAARYGRKILSADAKTGATTSLLEFPAAFAGQLDLPSAMNREWFVIAGQAKLDDGTVYETESFSYRPAGAKKAFVAAAANTQILLWQEP